MSLRERVWLLLVNAITTATHSPKPQGQIRTLGERRAVKSKVVEYRGAKEVGGSLASFIKVDHILFKQTNRS